MNTVLHVKTILFCLLIAKPMYASTFLQLKNSYGLFPKEFRSLSVLPGAIAAERGVLQRLYTFGSFIQEPKRQNYEQEALYKKAFYDWRKKLEKKHPVIYLLKKLFYEIPESDSFSVTKELSDQIVTSEHTLNAIAQNALAYILTDTNCEKPLLDFVDLPKIASKSSLKNVSKEITYPGKTIALIALSATIWITQKKNPEKTIIKNYYSSLLAILKMIVKKHTAPQTLPFPQLQHALQDLSTKPHSFTKQQLIEALGEPNLTETHGVPNAMLYELITTALLFRGNNKPEHIHHDTVHCIHEGLPITFSDCFESTLRNILNILLYEPEEERFTTKKTQLLPQIQKFYKKYPTLTAALSEAARIDWAKLMVNIPGIHYLQTIGKHQFEMDTTITNLIVALFHLLNIAKLNANIQAIHQKPKLYIPKLLPKIANYFSRWEPITIQENIGKFLIHQTYPNTENMTEEFTLAISKTHATLQPFNKALTLPLMMCIYQHLEGLIKEYPEFSFLIPIAALSAIANNNTCPPLALFSLPLENPQNIALFLEHAPRIPLSWKHIILHLLETRNEIGQRDNLKLLLFNKIVPNLKQNEAQKELTEYVATLKTAPNDYLFNKVRLLTKLINLQVFPLEREQALVLALAEKCSQSEHPTLQNYASFLFRALIQKNIAIEKILDICKRHIESNEIIQQNTGANILYDLIIERRAPIFIEQLIKSLLTSKSGTLQIKAIKIITRAAGENLILFESIQNALQLINQNNIFIQKVLFSLITLLLEKRTTRDLFYNTIKELKRKPNLNKKTVEIISNLLAKNKGLRDKSLR